MGSQSVMTWGDLLDAIKIAGFVLLFATIVIGPIAGVVAYSKSLERSELEAQGCEMIGTRVDVGEHKWTIEIWQCHDGRSFER